MHRNRKRAAPVAGFISDELSALDCRRRRSKIDVTDDSALGNFPIRFMIKAVLHAKVARDTGPNAAAIHVHHSGVESLLKKFVFRYVVVLRGWIKMRQQLLR